MKINTIYHPVEESVKERKNDLHRTSFSKSKDHHPFLKERELVRAINSTKISRMLAKPFVSAISYHKEGINSMCKHPTKPIILSSSFDNEVILTNYEDKDLIFSHSFNCKIKGIAVDENEAVYVGQKNNVIRSDNIVYNCKSNITNLCYQKDLLVSTHRSVDVFDIDRYSPKLSFQMEDVSVISANPSFIHLIGFANKSYTYIADVRINKIVSEIKIGNYTNAISFSPSDGYFMATGNEDNNGYLHDLRYVDDPINTLRGHVGAVTAIKYNPQGTEICTGSFDQSLRIFRSGDRKSRDVYYNKRMHNIFGVEYSFDGQYIISGSDDGSLRLWKAEASSKEGSMSKKEKDTYAYNQALIEKYKDVLEVDRINKHRFIPKTLKNQMKRVHEQHVAKENRKNKHKKNQQKDE